MDDVSDSFDARPGRTQPCCVCGSGDAKRLASRATIHVNEDGQLGESVRMSVHRGTGEVQLHVDMYLSLSLARVCDLDPLQYGCIRGWMDGAGRGTRERASLASLTARVFL